MFDFLKRFLPQAGPGALPAMQLPKPPNKQQSFPSFKTQVARTTSVLSQGDRRLANTDVTTFRTGTSTRSILRDMVASSPDLSATVNAYLRVGIPEKYTVIARDMDGEINTEATRLAQELLRRITMLGDPTLGYNPTTDLQSLSESLGKELLTYGAMAIELVLDKSRTPAYLQPVSVSKLKWREEDGGTYPVQDLSGNEVSLDIPTFFYTSIDQDLLTAYSDSPLESAIQAVLADGQFMNDLRKSMQRVIQPRLIATLIEDKVKESIPPEIANDETKLGEFYTNLITQLTTQLTDLQPEEALVSFDNVEYNMMNANTGSSNIGDTLRTVQNLIESKLAAGSKSMSAVLGRDANASSATTSTMLFMKNADIVRRKLNLMYSRALTVAIRLLNQDVFVEFTYADLDLRPQGELEAYKSMKQSRELELLSLGLISDEEACIALTGNLPPQGMKPLSGTMFKSGKVDAGNPNSQTSNMGKKDELKPDTPAQPKS
jgi:hypothetical protein